MTLTEIKDIINLQKAASWTSPDADSAYTYVLGLLEMAEPPKKFTPVSTISYKAKEPKRDTPRPRATNVADVDKIRRLYEKGGSAKEIAKELGYGYSTVAAHVKRFREQEDGLSAAEEAEVNELAKSLADVDE